MFFESPQLLGLKDSKQRVTDLLRTGMRVLNSVNFSECVEGKPLFIKMTIIRVEITFSI
ncbi:hypothetical protein HMPREF0766_11842 [Sphingobacterium spiritivorum ATCC 33861]|uniref:Uncharacterized protein n=1 Tax=Sphingobacterium spiritivorum ATCC 33861 TaxID=525373 RepID=D7VLH2_SPHSI|nr:hypothetical protein HMPREF0766_11842 [Sphingobacterium spiritivorum ATCC 33861]